MFSQLQLEQVLFFKSETFISRLPYLRIMIITHYPSWHRFQYYSTYYLQLSAANHFWLRPRQRMMQQTSKILSRIGGWTHRRAQRSVILVVVVHAEEMGVVGGVSVSLEINACQFPFSLGLSVYVTSVEQLTFLTHHALSLLLIIEDLKTFIH